VVLRLSKQLKESAGAVVPLFHLADEFEARGG
jgi:hypothetical protein